MKKTMIAVGISLVVGMAGCSVTKQDKETLSAVQEHKKAEDIGFLKISDMKQAAYKPDVQIPDLHLHETLLKNITGMHEDFLQAGMVQEGGKYTYGDITIDSVKETQENISFLLTFKEPVDDLTRDHVVNWFYLPISVAMGDNVTFDVANEDEKKQINWKVATYEKVGDKKQTKQIIFTAKTV